MAHKHITQRAARRYKLLAEGKTLQLERWCQASQPGVVVGAEWITGTNTTRMRMARKLGYGLLIVPRQDEEAADIYAVKV